MSKPKQDPWSRSKVAEVGFRADPRNKDLAGVMFGRLTVLRRAASHGHRTHWRVQCICGVEKEISQSSLVTGKAKSCGCLQAEVRVTANTKHGFNRTPTYTCWNNMHARCSNKKSKSFVNYGGRGINVCDRWELFSNFLEDMGEKPTGMTIERKDVNSGYFPENCCWATQETQDNNKRTTVFVDLDGLRLSMSQAAVKLNASPGRVRWAVQKYGDQWLSYVRAAAEIGRAL